MKIKGLVCSSILMLGLAGAAQAHEDLDSDGKFSVLIGAGRYLTDSDRGLDNGMAGEFGVGYIIDKHWAVEAIYTDITRLHNDASASVDAEMYRLDGLYHFDRSGHWTPYLAAGVGEISFEPDGSADSDETIINAGGGVKYAISKAASLRGDVRAIYGDEDSDLDGLVTLGLTYVFGAGTTAAPLDSDGDGVLDADDRCPGTPAGVTVNSKGCALDSDLDGVPNYLDKCHSTKAGVKVDSDGCPMLATDTVSIELEVLFDTSQADIKPEFMAEIQRVAEFMAQYKGAYAVIEGHTDSLGDAGYNKDLSQRRADAVRDVLVGKMKINNQRVTAEGYGEERPRASNETRDGRQLNRRVVAVLKAQVKSVITK